MSLFSGWFKKTIKIEDAITKAVASLKQAAGKDLVSLLLYGPAAERDALGGLREAKILVLLERADAAILKKMAQATQGWASQGVIKVLILGAKEFKSAADVFPLEFTDMQDNHRILHGEDPLRRLKIDTKQLPHQLSCRLKSRLIEFRQRCLSGEDTQKQVEDLIVALLPDFRALLRIKRNRPAQQRVRVIEDTSRFYRLNRRVFLQAHDVKWRGKKMSEEDLARLFKNLMGELEKVGALADRLQSANTAAEVPGEGGSEERARGNREYSGHGHDRKSRDRSSSQHSGGAGRALPEMRKDLVNAVKNLISEIPNRKKWEPKESERFQTDEQGRDTKQPVALRFGWDKAWLRFKAGKGEAPTVVLAAVEAKQKEEDEKHKEEEEESQTNLQAQSVAPSGEVEKVASVNVEAKPKGLDEKTRKITHLSRSVSPRSRKEKVQPRADIKGGAAVPTKGKVQAGATDRLPEEKFNW